MAEAVDRPLVVVGDAHYAPFEYLDQEAKPQGILVQYWREWSKKTGIRIEYRLMEWNAALQAVANGDADIVGGMFSTPERASQFLFGQPIYEVSTGIFFHESIFGIKTISDLSGFKVGVVNGDSTQEYLEKRFPQLELARFVSYQSLVDAATQNDIRVFVGDEPVIRFLLAQNDVADSYRVAEQDVYKAQIMPGVRKDNVALLELLLQHSDAVGDERIQEIVAGWSGDSLTGFPALGPVLLFLSVGVIGFLVLVLLNRRLRHRFARVLKKLGTSEERYQLAIKGTNDGIWDWDRETDQVYFSPRWKEILGYADAEIPNVLHSWKSRIHPEDYDRVMAANESFFSSNAEHFEVEYRMRHKDGTWHWVLGRGTCLRDQNGVPKRTAGAHSDISERKRAENALRRSEESLRDIIDNMMDGYYRADMHGKLVMANPSMASMLGYPDVGSLIGMDVAETFYCNPDDRKELLLKLFADGVVRSHHIVLRAINGENVVVETNSRLVRDIDTGVPLAVEGVVRNISARIQEEAERENLIQKLESKNDELERFTYTVSHDLKSPIITIKGFLGMLERDLKTGNRERIASDIERINSATDKMEQLLRELLELSRIGRMDNPKIEISLVEVVNEAIELTQGHLSGLGAEIVGTDGLPVVACDRPRMVQVFLNLLENAVKFRVPDRTLRIEFSTRMEPGFVVVCVRDNGIGIKPEYLETIFGLFQQLDQTKQGTGLGLALVRRIIENQGGRVWAESDGPKAGSAFCFTLPVA